MADSHELSSSSSSSSLSSNDSSDMFDGDFSDEESDVDGYGIAPVFGLYPYMFEPVCDSDEQAMMEAEEDELEDAKKLEDLSSWCQCGNCAIMETARECVCCCGVKQVQAKLDDPALAGAHLGCVTDHPGLEGICYNIWTLEVAAMAYKQRYGSIKIKGPANEKYRFVAYRQFVRWCWDYLGREVRVVIPSCMMIKIREAFPSTACYKGFKLAGED
ncbi:P2X purinoceptor 7-like [Lineus longissimus]|uniref:P2X purinoceptor 7-like n=1 Tax=Lineus longissimus TaxID=88925 RepID=UPI002B4F93B8